MPVSRLRHNENRSKSRISSAAICAGFVLIVAAASFSQVRHYDSFNNRPMENPQLGSSLMSLKKTAVSPITCPNADSLSTYLTSDNGQNGIAFEITAVNAIRLCQISMAAGGGGTGVSLQLWIHPDGLPASSSAFNDGQWVLIDSVVGFTMNISGYTVLPFDLSPIGMLSVQQKLGIAIFAPSNSGVGYRTGVSPYLFSDANMIINTQGWGLYGTSSANWTAPYSPRQFCG